MNNYKYLCKYLVFGEKKLQITACNIEFNHSKFMKQVDNINCLK